MIWHFVEVWLVLFVVTSPLVFGLCRAAAGR